LTTVLSGGILSIVSSVSFVSFDRENMYKQILLSDKELELLASIIQSYIDEKKTKPNLEINNAHIILRHISGLQTHKPSNQISFCGK
jgi:hypothetical protein